MLASDLDNPEYAGAQNPDNRLAVQFYIKAVKNEFESQQQGRPIFQDMDFVKIFVPGDSTSVIDTIARDDHKRRFPIQWARFQNSKEQETYEMGTPISEWPRVTKSQAEMLRALKFYTVESIASASDSQIQSIGMLAGTSPYNFRDMAQNFLKSAQGEVILNEVEQKATFAEQENEELRAQLAESNRQNEENTAKLAELQEQMAQLLEQKPVPAKRGRKPKATPEASE